MFPASFLSRKTSSLECTVRRNSLKINWPQPISALRLSTLKVWIRKTPGILSAMCTCWRPPGGAKVWQNIRPLKPEAQSDAVFRKEPSLVFRTSHNSKAAGQLLFSRRPVEQQCEGWSGQFIYPPSPSYYNIIIVSSHLRR